MGKLSSAVVQRKLASLRDVEEALARQVLYGGDLVTNLLEQVASIDEQGLVRLLGEIADLPPGPAGEIARPTDGALELVPGDIAFRHGMYPIRRDGEKLTVTVADRLSPDVEHDVSFALGVSLTQEVAPLVRIRQAISRDYGLPLDRRTHRVIAKLEGKPDPSPSIAPAPLASAPDIAALPRPPSIPPLGLPAQTDLSSLYGGAPSAAVTKSLVVSVGAPSAPFESLVPSPTAPPASPAIHEAVTAPAPAVAPPRQDPTPPLPAPSLLGHADTRIDAPKEAPSPARRAGSGQFALPVSELAAWSVRARSAPRRERPRRRGPYTAAEAEHDFSGAEGREQVLTAFFDFVSQYFEYSALFAVQGDLAEGRDAYGPGADRNKIAGIGVPLDMPGALADVRTSGNFSLAVLGRDGMDARFAKDLGRKPAKKVLLLPVVVRGRCVLILYGDCGDADVELSEVGDVIAFAPLVATALENVILRKKTAIRHATGGDPARPLSLAPQLRSRVPLPTREERVEALAQALETTVRHEEPSRGDKESKTTDPAIPSVRPGPSGDAKSNHGSRDAAPRASTPAQGTPVRAATLSQPPEGPIFELTTRRLTPSAFEMEEDVPDDGWDVPEPRGGKRRPPPLPSDGPEISIGVADADPDMPEVEPPSSEVVIATARAPHKRYSSDELRLPKVIVNIDHDLEKLVERVVAGDEGAITRVVELGARAASVLVARFPGPIKQESDRLGTPRPASQRGPILRALARIGQPAVPFLAVRTNDADAQIRSYATRLLGEIPSPESAQAVARRVMDGEADVRRAALDAGKLLSADAEARAVLRDRVAMIAEDANASVDARVAAVEALAHFRDEKAVPRLVRLVTHDDEVGKSAQWALGAITRQNFGREASAWDSWWRENAGRHRIEWLIDALMHEDSENRRAAGEELKAVTKEYFGYYDDLSRGERAKAQKRYREWWDSTGKKRFSGK
jgi:hypothetical protein